MVSPTGAEHSFVEAFPERSLHSAPATAALTSSYRPVRTPFAAADILLIKLPKAVQLAVELFRDLHLLFLLVVRLLELLGYSLRLVLRGVEFDVDASTAEVLFLLRVFSIHERRLD